MKKLRLNEVTICLRFKSSKWGLDQVMQDLERHVETSVDSGVGTGLVEDSLQDPPSVSLQWNLTMSVFLKRGQVGRESHPTVLSADG